MDVLTDSLRSLQLKTEVYGRLELSAPWGLKLDLGHPGFFHAVSRGSCWLEVEGRRIALAAGDWVFILGDAPHLLRDSPRTRTQPLPEIYAAQGAQCGGVLRHGGDGPQTTLISFSFGFAGTWLHRLLAGLPRVLHIKGDGVGSTRWVASIIQLVAAEMEAGRPGHEIVATRLADVLFIHALRAHLEAFPAEKGGWLRALEDPQLGKVLQQLHERPRHPWTVESMAKLASMSRSTFAERFQKVIGESPLTYLTGWRMHTASRLMANPDQSLTAIAEAVGYETDSAFGKAFKRHVGKTPGEYRRQLRSAPDVTPPH
ncbi:AraC family transcriptional regulator [Corallococcus praedator]|uniref:AraC family transcriptional regulator n=1 Tax=Corallococcus praedator TaxID=2316724 RepID=A0ABX9QRB1_9BACT|nr:MULTISPECIES: AraC family transcriptional regulator [Corallococcus]RKH21161.1 AraC family transcriptional regulator [Corallococcus sp. CA047B]RKH35899.1 AraC family transcriptional regulator [Corallococcus sp. CA031C]RKI17637.1 AraC family transcriptional regulator [Corallococcus praedator]